MTRFSLFTESAEDDVDDDDDNVQGVNLRTLKRQKKLRRKGVRVSGGKEDVCYISLKPFSKRERWRQQQQEVEEAAAAAAVAVGGEDGEEEESPPEEFVPRSPVPLPDASTCRPILVQLGFALSERRKKGDSSRPNVHKVCS